ncbi:MAG: FG-GAP repeat domain-containing protein [Bacteriovoracaceae bacterium]
MASKLWITKSLVACALFIGCSKADKSLKKLKHVKEVSKKEIKSPSPLSEDAVKGLSAPQFPQKQKNLVDVTKKYGLEGVTGTHLYVSDLNNDGFDDLIVLPSFYSIPKFYFYNSKLKKFVLTDHPVLNPIERASFLAFVDLDHDGIKDAIFATFNQRSAIRPEPIRVFKGRISTSKLTKKKSYTLHKSFSLKGTEGPVSSLNLFDFNNDGNLDLYVTNWFNVRKSGAKTEHNRLYAGKGNLKFTSLSEARFFEKNSYESSDRLKVSPTPTFGSTLCDFNGDGRPEILEANTSGVKNRLWLAQSFQGKVEYFNIANFNGFSEDSIGRHLDRGAGHTFYGICTDYNQDSFLDVALGELFHSYDLDNRDRSSILTGATNTAPYRFLRTEYHQDDGTRNWNQGDKRGNWLDINLDGLDDLIVDNTGFPPKSRLVYFKQHPDHSFEDIADEVGVDHVNPSGTVYLDVNKDGRPEVLSGQTQVRDSKIKNRIYLYENRYKYPRQALKLHYNSGLFGVTAVLSHSHNKEFSKVLTPLHGAQSSQNASFQFFSTNEGYFKELSVIKNGKPLEVYKLKRFKSHKLLNLYACLKKQKGAPRIELSQKPCEGQ